MANYRAKKRFGQNFLQDQSIIDSIVYASLCDNCTPIEIGPGLGALTEKLITHLSDNEKLITIEIDNDIVAFFKQQTYVNQLSIVHQDVLTVDFAQWQDKPLSIVGNLPYNISTPLLFKLIPYRSQIKQMVFMLQKEVIDRILSPSHQKTYGRLSVMMQYYFDIEHICDVPPEAFSPQPKVNSAVIKLIPKTITDDPIEFRLLEKVCKQAFAHKRKNLNNNLIWFDDNDFEALGLDKRARAENLSLADFKAICLYLLRHKNFEID